MAQCLVRESRGRQLAKLAFLHADVDLLSIRIPSAEEGPTLRTSGKTWSGRAMSWTASTVSIMSYVGSSGRPPSGLLGFNHAMLTCPRPFSSCLCHGKQHTMRVWMWAHSTSCADGASTATQTTAGQHTVTEDFYVATQRACLLQSRGTSGRCRSHGTSTLGMRPPASAAPHRP